MEALNDTVDQILPVFAGMIRSGLKIFAYSFNSPRIRGDDPQQRRARHGGDAFSPYSRG